VDPVTEVPGNRTRPARRWPFILGAVFVLLIAAVLLAWFLWLPRFRPALGAGERYGIDVSSHQGTIDWRKVAADGMSFAYVKATEGADLVDPSFDRNWTGASQAGLDRGAYHFFTLCSSGLDQAENFLRTVPDDPHALPPAVDLELAGNCSTRPDQTVIDRELASFLDAVETKTGKEVTLYIGKDFENRYHVRSRLDRPLWVRRVLFRPNGPWAMWQVGGFAKVDGIDGRVDLDVAAVAPAGESMVNRYSHGSRSRPDGHSTANAGETRFDGRASRLPGG
jgi:lysozyme